MATRPAPPLLEDCLSIEYPLAETVFPPDIAAPVFRWTSTRLDAAVWRVEVEFEDGRVELTEETEAPRWVPADAQWESIKSRSVSEPASVNVLGFRSDGSLLCRGSVSIRTSADPVGAPLFYREVPLPFIDAVKDPSRIRWRFGSISSAAQPPVVLDNLPVCGNCHSFSAGGGQLGMDVDYANDRGSYVLCGVQKEMTLSPEKIITWSDYQRSDKQPTFGLLSQVSPDGKHVISTVKDRSVFVARPDLEYSQLFFPIKGILAVYNREKKTFASLPGADDPQYVQSNPAWSPDGQYVVFARAPAYQLRTPAAEGVALLTERECAEFLKEGKTFLFDLYRVPFNDGRGGRAEAIRGASGNGMSNYFAKYSPDGKWIVFCRAKSYMLLQPDSELYIIPASGGEARRLACNTRRMNSWHTWSPNGRWLAFTSKANGPYSQLFLTHIDDAGQSSPPVELAHLTATDRAANIPEFVNLPADGIRTIREQFVDDYSHWRAGREYVRAKDWPNAERMYRKALAINPRNVEAYGALATVFIETSRFEEAEKHLAAALDIAPKNAELHNNLGALLNTRSRRKEAIEHYERALRLKPDYARAHSNLGAALAVSGSTKEAIGHYEQALRLEPDYPTAHYNLGLALDGLNRTSDAVSHYERALQLKPDYTEAHFNLAVALSRLKRTEEAVRHYKDAVRLKPDDAEAHNGLGIALCRLDRAEEAIECFEQARRLKPDDAAYRRNLANALSLASRPRKNGEQPPKARKYLERAVQLNPGHAEAHNNLAWLLATQEPEQGGDPARAILLAERACQLTDNKVPGCLDTLAAAYAAAGRFSDATAVAEKASRLATSAGDAELTKEIDARLRLYRSGRAHRGPAGPARNPRR